MTQGTFDLKKDNELIREYGKWILVRKALNLSSFGINMVDIPAGESIKEHDEVERDQEEVFFMVKGDAVMIIDGKEYEAPEGTFVRLDPDLKRNVKNNTNKTIRVMISSAPRTSGYQPMGWA